MLLAHYGHRFLAAFNRREGTALTPRQFFDQHLFPVLFDDETFLLDSGNTPFGQADKFSAKNPLTETRRRDVKALFHSKLDDGTPPAGNDVMFGGVALDATASTSGLLTDLRLPVDAADAYASWIGAALALCVQGGWCLLVDDDAVLLATFDGWAAYRTFLRTTPRFKGRQLPTWNAHRLAQVLTGGSSDLLDVVHTLKPDVNALPTISWAALLLALSKHLHAPTSAYVYKLGQQNSTVGLVTLDLPKVETIGQWYARLAGTSGPDLDAELARVYDTAFGFDTACTFGVVGAAAMKPSKIEDFTPGGARSKMPDRSKMDRALFTLYHSWILAMLDPNSQDLYALAEETADALLAFEATAVGGKTNHQKAVNEALDQTSRRGFTDALPKLIELSGGTLYEPLKALVNTTKPDQMSSEQFRLFVTLVRFHLAGLRAKA